MVNVASRELQGSVLANLLIDPPVHLRAVSVLQNLLIGYAGDSCWHKRGELIELFKYLSRFAWPVQELELFYYDHNDSAKNNVAQLMIKHFNTPVTQHLYIFKITITWNAQPCEEVSCGK